MHSRDRSSRIQRRPPAWVALAVAFSLIGPSTLAGFGTASAQEPESLAPFLPTPQGVVDRMLEIAGVGEDDVVYDLGCGDGRIVITAAERYGARGVGVDIDPLRVAESKQNARRAGVSHLVEFFEQDALKVDVSSATVVTLSLLSSALLKLRPILTRQLRPGARIVSVAFGMGDWEADTVDRFTDARGNSRTLYAWTHDGTVRD